MHLCGFISYFEVEKVGKRRAFGKIRFHSCNSNYATGLVSSNTVDLHYLRLSAASSFSYLSSPSR